MERFASPEPSPLAFSLGEETRADILTRARRTQVAGPDPAGAVHEFTHKDLQTGLSCRIELREFRDFGALEWVVWLRNDGADVSPILGSIYPLDLCRSVTAEQPIVVHHARGSLASYSDFAPLVDPLVPGSPLRLYSRNGERGGNSSEDALPFFNLQWGDRGLLVGLGWTGPWVARFERDDVGKLTVRAGLEGLRLRLRPGEEIRGPRILMLEWQGDRQQAHNRWRRLLLEHFSPRPGGEPFAGLISYGNWGCWMDADRHIGEINFLRDHDLPVECYWVDAGWTDMSRGWPAHTSQQVPSPALFPDGMRPLADAAHHRGMKFLLWMVPESVHPDVGIGKAHPEWLGQPVKAADGDAFYSLDHGDPQVNAFMIEHFAKIVADYGLDVLRQDGTSQWPADGDPERVGMSHLRFVRGFYDFWDGLLARHPGLMIDNCACGGRKIDLETVRRSVALWRSDSQAAPFDPVSNQGFNCGLLQWIPLCGATVMLDRLTPYAFRSAYSPALMLSWPMLPNWKQPPTPGIDPRERWSNVDLDLLKKLLREYIAIRPYLFGDFYPLTPYSIASDTWMAWQFDRPDLGEGMVQAFRREHSPFVSARFKLRGLDAEATYRVTDLDQPDSAISTSGRALQERGLTIAMSQTPQAVVVTYKRSSSLQGQSQNPKEGT
jgi:alpha-galactosidase